MTWQQILEGTFFKKFHNLLISIEITKKQEKIGLTQNVAYIFMNNKELQIYLTVCFEDGPNENFNTNYALILFLLNGMATYNLCSQVTRLGLFLVVKVDSK